MGDSCLKIGSQVINSGGGGGGGTWGSITGTLSDQTDLQNELDLKQAIISVGNNKILSTDGSGLVINLPDHDVNSLNGVDAVHTLTPAGGAGMQFLHTKNAQINPTANSPNITYGLVYNQVNFDTDDDGFSFGTAGNAAKLISNTFNNVNKSDVGALVFTENYFNLGNGTDAIDVAGISYSFGFGNINANVNISQSIQGYGFQFSANAAATISTGANINAFYDFATINCTSPGYTSYTASPTIANIYNNTNYTAFNSNPTITSFTGNAGVNGISIAGTYGTFNANSGFNGVSVNPTIASARYAAGLYATMDNVTPYAGVSSTLTEQDLTFTFVSPGDNNSFTVEFTPGATAGSEVVSLTGNAIEVQIESGVSTATQIKAAMDAFITFSGVLTITISGVGGNAQVTFGPENFVNGVNPGQVYAAYLDGNVEITGNLTFGGALSIGKLNAFATQAIVDGGGVPGSIHGLISSPTIAASTTVANGDTIGVNTAMLLTVGDNAVVTTNLVGLSALALPAVITMGTGSTVDQVAGATFAISMDAGATGGTITNVDVCRSVVIPNGATTITNLRGYKFDLPFGDPGTTSWGFYESPGVNNYFAGNLLIGGTAGSDDTVTNSSVAIEVKSTTKAVVLSRMTTTQRDALTAINGMTLYNTTTDKFQGYAGGSWVDLH